MAAAPQGHTAWSVNTMIPSDQSIHAAIGEAMRRVQLRCGQHRQAQAAQGASPNSTQGVRMQPKDRPGPR